MNRLTQRGPDGHWRIRDFTEILPAYWVACNRLAAYEDTGLEPEEIARAFSEEAVINLAGQTLGVPTARLRELAQADREERVVVLPDAKYTDADGETALRRAMYICGVQNNPVTRYTADAIAEKLTREEAKAALKGEDHETYPV